MTPDETPPATEPEPEPEPVTPPPNEVRFQDRRGTGNERRQGGRRASEQPRLDSTIHTEIDYDRLAQSVGFTIEEDPGESESTEATPPPTDEPPNKQHWAQRKIGRRKAG